MSENRVSTPAECANCGAAIPRRAQACPECGADERTGWREQSVYDGLNLPEDAFEDEAERRTRRRTGLPWYWIATALLLIALGVAGFLVFR